MDRIWVNKIRRELAYRSAVLFYKNEITLEMAFEFRYDGGAFWEIYLNKDKNVLVSWCDLDFCKGSCCIGKYDRHHKEQVSLSFRNS